MIPPKAFIASLRDAFPERYAPFSGGCYKFHRLLKAVYPEATGFYNGDHVITWIDGNCWDIDGKVNDFTGFLKFPSQHYSAEFMERAFSRFV